MAKIPLAPKNPERICWGCDKYCPEDDLACGNGTIRTPHPIELFGPDWLEWSLDRSAGTAFAVASNNVTDHSKCGVAVPGDHVRVRITETPKERELDGVPLEHLRKGMVRAVPASLGSWLIAQGYAAPEMRRTPEEDQQIVGVKPPRVIAKDSHRRRSTDH